MDYVKLALSKGASSAVKFSVEDIAFDNRTILKCVFGCGTYGTRHTCPLQKARFMPWDYERILKSYKWGVIIGGPDSKTAQKISYDIERQAFLDGYYFAFSLSDCGLCETCTKSEGKECRFPEKARPSFHSVGIDIFKTVHKFGLPLDVLKTYDEQANYYSAVFVE